MTLFEALERYPLATALKGCGLTLRDYRSSRQYLPDFARQCDAAIAAREARLLDVVGMATVEDWRAGAWLLERTAGQEFREVKEVQQRVQLELEKLLDALEPRMPPASFGDLLKALADLSGAATVRALPEGEGT